MGRRGPKPTPAYLKILAGNPGGHELSDSSPKAKCSLPRCPSRYMKSPPARHIWKALGKRLADLGILTTLDAYALELLVDSVLAYSAAVKNSDERRQESCYKQLRQMLREFGLTPASLCSVKVAEQPDKQAKPDPAARYFA